MVQLDINVGLRLINVIDMTEQILTTHYTHKVQIYPVVEQNIIAMSEERRNVGICTLNKHTQSST